MTLVIHLKKIFLALIVAGLWLLASASPALASHFSMSVAPSSGNVDRGGQISFVATATYTGLPYEAIGFNTSGLPNDASATYSTGTCTPTCSTIVTITTGSAAAGIYALTIEGSGSSHSASATYSLTIIDPTQAAPISYTLTDDGTFSTTGSATGGTFGAGTNSSTAVSGSGTGASVRLVSRGALTALSPATIATGSAPRDTAISADGASVYVTNNNGNTVSMYSRNTGTGLLTALSPATIATGSSPYDIAISADGASVYVTNAGSQTISMYSRNTGTGLLTALSPATIASSSLYITISADGASVYAVGPGLISMYSRNTSVSSGTFTSAAINLGGAAGFAGKTLDWSETLPSGTDIQIQIRSASTQGGLSSAAWYGPTGTGDWYTASGGSINTIHDGARWIQYKAVLTSPSPYTETPLLNNVTVGYENSTNYNFTLSPSPSSGEVVAGGGSSKVSTITVTVQNPQDASITDAVNFTATVSPSGPTVFLSPTSCLPSSGTCAIDLYASGATVGAYTITIAGDNASATYPIGLIKTTTFALAVIPPLNFSLALSLGSGEVIRGYEATSYIDTALTVGYINGANEIVSITSNAPAGITFNPSPTACAPYPSSCASTIRMSASSAVADNYTITITGTSATSGGTRTATFTLRVRDPLNYSLSASPSNGAVFQGNSTTSTITGIYGGYPAGTESVAVSSFTSVSNPSAFSSLPSSGTISVSFAPGTCTLGEAQTSCTRSATISTSSNVPPGTYAITISGTSSITSTVRTTAYELTVSGPFDFTMAMDTPIAPCTSTAGCAVEQATSIAVPITVSSISPLGENLTFSITGLPANTTYAVASVPATCIPSINGSCAVTFTISPTGSAPLGTYAINIVGKSIKQIHSLPFEFTVAQGFTFDVSPSNSTGVAVRGGSAASVIANITLLSGIGKPVVLSINGLSGTGVTADFPSGQSCTPNCQLQITFIAPVSAVLGPHTLTIVGAEGTQTKEVTYILTVVDPFEFSLTLSSTQGSILQGGNDAPCAGDEVLNPVSGKCDKVTVAEFTWLSGGSGTEVITLSASVPNAAPFSSADMVQFSPASIINLNSATTPLYSTVTLTAPVGMTADSYTVIVVASSAGVTPRTKTYNLTVGTTLDFSLSLLPDKERVLQGTSSAPVDISAVNNLAQPASSNISFVIGDTSKYKLPDGVTVAPYPIAPCTLGSALNATCSSSITFNVGFTAINATYLIPIVGTSGPVKRIVYYTLKVGLLDLVNYESPDFLTDAHQRPQVGFTWDPPAVFAGDTVQFDATPSTVYAGEPNLSASTPASDTNADFSWSFSGITGGSTLINPHVLYQNSGIWDISIVVTDAIGGCYTSTSSAPEDCSCPLSLSDIIPSGGVTVSKARPSFREITPQ